MDLRNCLQLCTYVSVSSQKSEILTLFQVYEQQHLIIIPEDKTILKKNN